MPKVLLILTAFSFTFLFSYCSKFETNQSEKKDRKITLEIAHSEVIKLNGKEIHLSFLENQIAFMAKNFNLTIKVEIQPNALTGVVHDVQKAVSSYELLVYSSIIRE